MRRAKRDLDGRDFLMALCCGLIGTMFLANGLWFAVVISALLVIAFTANDRTL